MVALARQVAHLVHGFFESSGSDPNGRRLKGRLADFAILLGELDVATLDEIIHEGMQWANLAGLASGGI